MDLWLHDQISDMIHHAVIMADMVWPIFKWPLNDHGHGLAENNPSAPGRPIFGLLRASVYLEPLPAYFFFCILSPGWSDCTLWPSVGCIWLGSWRCWPDPVKKAHNTQNLLCHYLQTLSKRFSICCDWLGVGHNGGFNAARSISVCFHSVDSGWTNQHPKHICNQVQNRVRIDLQNWVNWF